MSTNLLSWDDLGLDEVVRVSERNGAATLGRKVATYMAGLAEDDGLTVGEIALLLDVARFIEQETRS